MNEIFEAIGYKYAILYKGKQLLKGTFNTKQFAIDSVKEYVPPIPEKDYCVVRRPYGNWERC